MTDDDMILVIVGDEPEEVLIPTQFKQECLEEENSLSIEDIIEKAEKHGQYLGIKVEPHSKYGYLEGNKSPFMKYQKSIKREEPPDDEELEYTPSDNEEQVLEEEQKNTCLRRKHSSTHSDGKKSVVHLKHSKLRKLTKKKTLDKKHRKHYRILSPNEHRSFVEELRNQNPELRNNTKLLVNTLCEIMRSVKPPPFPKRHFVYDDKYLKCPQCDHKSKTIPEAGRHYQKRHGPRYLVCFACGVDFRSTTNLYKHEKRCIARDQNVVLKARAVILGKKGRGRPFVMHPQGVLNSFPCTECSAVFRSKYTLTSHLDMHRGERRFQCEKCPAAYTSKSALMRHVKQHTNIEFVCDHCKRSFKVKSALVTHMNTHQAVRRFGCEFCERRFAQKQGLQRHVDKVHKKLPPPHACQICPKRYRRITDLKNHMKSQHGLAIITPKMFFKKLPTLIEAEKTQVAKIVFKANAHEISQNLR